jgi:hypothetical protein
MAPWEPDDSWRDGYDEWKLRSPYDDEPEDECIHEEREISWEGFATCGRCGHTWWASAAELETERLLNEDYDKHCRREERCERVRQLVGRLAFWRRWRKPQPNDDEIPF